MYKTMWAFCQVWESSTNPFPTYRSHKWDVLGIPSPRSCSETITNPQKTSGSSILEILLISSFQLLQTQLGLVLQRDIWFTVIALAEHTLIWVKLNKSFLQTQSERALNAPRCLWVHKGTRAQGFSAEMSKEQQWCHSLPFAFIPGLVTGSGLLLFSLFWSQNNPCAPRSNRSDCSRAQRGGSCPGRAVGNGMSLSNQSFAAFLDCCSNIPVPYQGKKCD